MKNILAFGLLALMIATTGITNQVNAQSEEQVGICLNYSLENIPMHYRSWDAVLTIEFPEINHRDRWNYRLPSGSDFNSFYFLKEVEEYKGLVTLRVTLYRNGCPQHQGCVSKVGYWNAWTDQAPIVISEWIPTGK